MLFWYQDKKKSGNIFWKEGSGRWRKIEIIFIYAYCHGDINVHLMFYLDLLTIKYIAIINSTLA